jgi:hypothetical protein
MAMWVMMVAAAVVLKKKKEGRGWKDEEGRE